MRKMQTAMEEIEQVDVQVGMKKSNHRDNDEGNSKCVDNEGNAKDNGAQHKNSVGNDMGEGHKTELHDETVRQTIKIRMEMN